MFPKILLETVGQTSDNTNSPTHIRVDVMPCEINAIGKEHQTSTLVD